MSNFLDKSDRTQMLSLEEDIFSRIQYDEIGSFDDVVVYVNEDGDRLEVFARDADDSDPPLKSFWFEISVSPIPSE